MTVLGEIWSYTGEYIAKREPYTGSVNEDRKRPFFLRLSPYVSVYVYTMFDPF
jgi:hypothetical protein